MTKNEEEKPKKIKVKQYLIKKEPPLEKVGQVAQEVVKSLEQAGEEVVKSLKKKRKVRL